MKLDSEQIRKLNLFSYNPYFLKLSQEILCDYIYASLACSFISLTNFELDILLNYSSNRISKRKVGKLIFEEKGNKTNIEFDDFLNLGRLLNEMYKFSDGIFIKNQIYKQKKIYTLYHRYQEVLDFNVFRDLTFLNNVISNKKIIYVYFDDIKVTKLPFKNVNEIIINKDELKSYNSWLEWFDVIKMRIMIQNFDIAFISLGIYSNLLNYFIAQTLHKIAITKGE